MTKQQIMIEAHKRTRQDMQGTFQSWEPTNYAYYFRLNLLQVYAERKPVFYVQAGMLTDGKVKHV